MLNRKKEFRLQHQHAGEETKKKSKSSVYKGLLLAMLSGVFYSIVAMIVKRMKNLHPGQLAVYRFLAIFAFSFPETVKCQENILGPKKLRFLLVMRGIFGATNVFLNFLAFRYLPLGEAAVIIFSVPVFVTVAARLFLKEPCGIFQTITIVITVIGIILTSKVPQRLAGNSFVYTTQSAYGLLAAIFSLLFSTCRFVVLRKVKSVHHSITMFISGWVSLLETVILTFVAGNFQWHDCGVQSISIIILGVASFAGQTLLTIALQCELAGPVSTVRAASDIVLAFVWQTLIFRDIPDAFTCAGAVLVAVSVIFVGLKKWVSALAEDSTYRKKLGWMLK